MRTRTVIATLLVAALAGCGACDSVPESAVTDCDAQIVPGGAAVDILFVVDDSGSMDNNQAKLAANLGTFIDKLLSSGIALDVQVGVTNTSVERALGTGTAYTSGPSTGKPYPAGALVSVVQDPDGVATGTLVWGIAYDPTHLTSTWGGPRVLSSSAMSKAQLARDFKANVAQGSFGSGKEQPLRAMKLALDEATKIGGVNAGFLRAGSRLAVVILTDEDDCSDSVAPAGNCGTGADLDSVAAYADDVDYVGTTVGGSLPVVAIIAEYDSNGNPAVCESGTGPAAPQRLDDFLNQLEPGPARTRTVKASVCTDFGTTLLQIAQAIVPQTMPLQKSPADWRMLVVGVQRGGASVPCTVAEAGSSQAASADVVYTPAPPGGNASLTFQSDCKLGLGDQVALRIVCIR